MSFLPTSPRRRRHLAWGAAATAGLATVIAVFVFIPSHGGATKQLDGTFIAPDKFGSSADSREAKFAGDFIHDLAARRNLGARYNDLTPSYRSKQPRSAWVLGSVPIPPQRLIAGSDHFVLQPIDGHTARYLVEVPRRQPPAFEYYAITIDDTTGQPLIDSVEDEGVIQPVPTDFGNHVFGTGGTPNLLLASILYGVVGIAVLALAVVAFVAIRRARRAGRRFAYPDKPMPTLPGGPKQPGSDHDKTRDGSV